MASERPGGTVSGVRDIDLLVDERRRRLEDRLRSVTLTAALPVDTLDGVLRGPGTPRPGTDLEVLHGLFDETDQALHAVTERLLPAPLLAARRVNLALERVQAASTLDDVLRSVPSELCWVGDFDRVLFSRVEGSSWVPATWFTPKPEEPASIAFGELLRGARFAMTNGSIEAEIVRRRVTALVTDAALESRTFPLLLDVAQCPAYVVAPVVSGGTVIGLLHGDAAISRRPLAEADRVTLRAFADGVGLILERLALVEALEEQRRQIRAALAAAEQVVDELCRAPVDFAHVEPAATCAEPRRTTVAPDDGFTAREREVFGLLVSGATNAEIADRLTVSETTVKSHVKHILRKMRVANRAEAIAKYLRGPERPGVSR